MCRCANCQYPQHEQYKGHKGCWSCSHPYRRELDNKGHFTYPENHNPAIVICETPKQDFGDEAAHLKALEAARTPVWCYYEAVERAKAEQPGFDPDIQRQILWPKTDAKEIKRKENWDHAVYRRRSPCKMG